MLGLNHRSEQAEIGNEMGGGETLFRAKKKYLKN